MCLYTWFPSSCWYVHVTRGAPHSIDSLAGQLSQLPFLWISVGYVHLPMAFICMFVTCIHWSLNATLYCIFFSFIHLSCTIFLTHFHPILTVKKELIYLRGETSLLLETTIMNKKIVFSLFFVISSTIYWLNNIKYLK